jgi:hypothetical protein
MPPTRRIQRTVAAQFKKVLGLLLMVFSVSPCCRRRWWR